MLEHTLTITVQPGLEITSVWAIPDAFMPGQTDAIILAHGAGNDMNHPFMSVFHQAFAQAGFLSVKFNFPYTEQGRKAPDRAERLMDTWKAVIDAVITNERFKPRRLFLAGKSMGGRMASMVAAQGAHCDGLIFLGYPLHPPKQPGKTRTEHWPTIHCPSLFIEGTRDSLCDLGLLQTLLPQLGGKTTLKIIEGGDHSFKVPKYLGRDQDAVFTGMIQTTVNWIRQL